ncbi:uncharacterized protein K452DRAFT_301618 [Aplosporella prunicola CBS 121167]|uniref:Uncharacterized protein n=1 Tax=Aplosporella prunicola CBS 121167 TaxID=1176127 RepID=A0A6A6B2S8_9PEZI|nr:uncharacterized protein K452DRAFT_301618 [Aplosporella prunicola CBS 121167]KAF2137898.1 hypothetical protein K452DRAFT_301618 [Aplosporella prunicola CBS 121167]
MSPRVYKTSSARVATSSGFKAGISKKTVSHARPVIKLNEVAAILRPQFGYGSPRAVGKPKTTPSPVTNIALNFERFEARQRDRMDVDGADYHHEPMDIDDDCVIRLTRQLESLAIAEPSPVIGGPSRVYQFSCTKLTPTKSIPANAPNAVTAPANTNGIVPFNMISMAF